MRDFKAFTPDGRTISVSCEHFVTGEGGVEYSVLSDKIENDITKHDPKLLRTFPLDCLVVDAAYLHDPSLPGGDDDTYVVEFNNIHIQISVKHAEAYTDKKCVRLADCSDGRNIAVANIPSSAFISKINHGKEYLRLKERG